YALRATSSAVGSPALSIPPLGLCPVPESLRGVVPTPRAPGTIFGAGDSPAAPGVVLVIPAPAPAPDSTPEKSAPREPTDKLASRAIVSLMLSPCRGAFPRPAFCLLEPGSAASFNLGSTIPLNPPPTV